MIEWIALVLASNAQNTASSALHEADKAVHNTHKIGLDPLVVIRPVDLVDTYPDNISFFMKLIYTPKKVLKSIPWTTLSIKRSDIKNLEEYTDDLSNSYVLLTISKYADVHRVRDDGENAHIIKLRVPGTIEEITKVLNG